MGGHNIPLRLHQILFDCIATFQDYKDLKKAMAAARPDDPAHTRIRLFFRGIFTTALIRVDPLGPLYLLGGWQLSDNLIPLPHHRLRLC
jgi:hypothetical protein